MNERSGNIQYNNRLVGFIYDLMRDHVTPGVIEKVLGQQIESDIVYTNGWLAQYANDVANRLCPKPTVSVQIDVLRTHILAVKEGFKTPQEAAEQIFESIKALYQ